MDAIILKTKPYSMFRLGSGSLNETDDIIHSDTLFSALVSIHSQIFDNTDLFVEAFDKGDIKISSAFPMLMDKCEEQKIFFLPKPEINLSVSENIKEEKKIRFISIDSYKYLCDNLNGNSNNIVGFSDRNFFHSIGSAFAVTKPELKTEYPLSGFIAEIVTPKTKVHSKSQEDSFYHETDIQLIPLNIGSDDRQNFLYPHFYFLHELSASENLKSEFMTCLRVLVDEGIGGERSTGKGHFEKIIETTIELNVSNKSDQYMLVSIFNPSTQAEFNSFDKYEIILRGGGSVSLDTEDETEEQKPEYSNFRKKQVKMISEGAVLSGRIEGRLVDITPEKGSNNKYYRNGKSFTIPLG